MNRWLSASVLILFSYFPMVYVARKELKKAWQSCNTKDRVLLIWVHWLFACHVVARKILNKFLKHPLPTELEFK